MRSLVLLTLLSAAPATLLTAAPAVATECPDPTPPAPSSPWNAQEAWMHAPGWFTPVDDPRIVPASSESYDRGAPLMTVTVGAETRAYPVEAMAYHHVANDVIGDTPIAVTY